MNFSTSISTYLRTAFEIHYASGVLPETFPEPRAKVTRAEKAAAKAQKKAPTYAFAIGSYIIDRNGTLSGEKNEELTEALAVQGFTAA